MKLWNCVTAVLLYNPIKMKEAQAFSVALETSRDSGKPSLTVRYTLVNEALDLSLRELNALLVQWPRLFEPSDVSVQWLTTIHNSHGSVMDVVILVVVILSHNQYNRSQERTAFLIKSC